MARWFDKELAEAIQLLEQAEEILNNLAEQQEEKFQNYPENLENSEQGNRMTIRIDEFETYKGNIEELKDEIGYIE